MITFGALVARVPPLALTPLTADLGAGIHALLGGRDDGPNVVLAVLAGSVRARAGRVRILDALPGAPKVRPAVAFVPLDVALPEPLRVDEALATAAHLRGEPARDPLARLSPFGVGALAKRSIRSLSREEARAVALVEALTSSAKVLLLEEPLAAVDSRAVGGIEEALRSRARDGACVVIATGSARDARTLAEDVLTFSRGALVRRASASDPLVLAGPRGASVRVVASDPKRLAAALAGDPSVRTVTLEEGLLVVGGADVAQVAAAVARAALQEDVTIDLIRPELLRDDELRAAAAGDAAGAYRAAYERALGPAPAPAPQREESAES